MKYCHGILFFIKATETNLSIYPRVTRTIPTLILTSDSLQPFFSDFGDFLNTISDTIQLSVLTAAIMVYL